MASGKKSIDNLEITISANARQASQALDMLVEGITNLANAMNGIDMTGFTNGIRGMGEAVKTVNMQPLEKSMSRLSKTMSTYSRNSIKVSNAQRTSISAFSSFRHGVDNIYFGMSKINSKFDEFISKLKRSNKATKTFAQTVGMLYARFWLLIRGAKALVEAVKTSMNYIEVLNYFEASMGQVAERGVDQWSKMGYNSAEAYYNSFQDRAKKVTKDMSGFFPEADGTLTPTKMASLGMNPQQLMQYQAQFAQMSSSMGTTSEQALMLSEVLTKLGADLASVKNMNFEDTWKDLASGLVGMSRTLDKYGTNIRSANMEMKLHELGIDATVKSLSQADKALLRTIILLESTKYGWSDLSETLNTPANQMRMLANNVKLLGQMIGNILLPAVSKILPILNAFVIMLQRLFAWLAKILKIDLTGLLGNNTGYDNSNLSDLLDDSEALADSLDDDTDSAKKLKKQLQGFDALNNLTSKDDDKNKDSGLVSGLLNDAFIDAVSDYLNAWEDAFNKLENKAQELADKIQAFFLRLLNPIIEGWKSAGYEVVEGWKHALSSIKELATSIGTSFWEVWEQKRTSKIFQNLFLALGDILDTVGILAEKLKVAWEYADNGTRILEGIRDAFYYISIHVEKMARNTKKWAEDLDLTPLLSKISDYVESLAPVIDTLAGIVEDFYNDVLLKLAKWTLEKGLPDLIQVFTDFNNDVKWVELREHLRGLWDAIEKFGETVGEGVIIFFDRLTDATSNFLNGKGQDIIDWFANFVRNIKPEQVANAIELIIKALIGLKLSLLAFEGLRGASNLIEIFTKLKPLAKGFSTALAGANTKVASMISYFKKLMNLPALKLFVLKTDATRGIKSVIQSFREWGKSLPPIQTALLTIVTVFAEFKAVKNAFYDITKGSDNLAKSIGKVVVAVTGAGAVLTALFGVPTGLIITGITAVIGALMGVNDAFKDMAQEIIDSNLSSVMSSLYASNGGLPITEAMKALADQISQVGDGFAKITTESQGFYSAKESITSVANSIELIQIKMENGVLSVEEGVAKLTEQFDQLAQITQEKFNSIENTLMSAFGEHGVLNSALENIGVDTRGFISTITQLDDAVMDEITALNEELKTLEYGTAEYEEKSRRLQELTGATDETTTATQKFNDEMKRMENLDWSELFPQGEFNASKFTSSLEDITNSMNNTIDQMEASRGKLEDVLYEELNEAIKIGDVTAQNKIQSMIDNLDTAYDNMEADIKKRGLELADQMQEYLVKNVGEVVDKSKREYENLEWSERVKLKWQGIDNADDFAQRALEEYQNNTIKPVSDGIERSFEELGVEGAGWANDAMQNILLNGFTYEADMFRGGEDAIVSKISDNFTSIVDQATEQAIENSRSKMVDLGEAIPSGAIKGIEAGTKDYKTANETLIEKGISQAETTLDSHSPSRVYEEIGKNIVAGLDKGISQNSKTTTTTLTMMLNNMTTPFRNVGSTFTIMGANLMTGLSNGITAGASRVLSNVSRIASSITNAFRSVWQIHSPSKVMDEVGIFFMQGFQEGIESMYTPIEDSFGKFENNLAQAPDVSDLSTNASFGDITTTTTYNADNTETNALLRQQNSLLQAILEKEIGIDSGDLFRSVQNSANSYYKMTGTKAFA